METVPSPSRDSVRIKVTHGAAWYSDVLKTRCSFLTPGKAVHTKPRGLEQPEAVQVYSFPCVSLLRGALSLTAAKDRAVSLQALTMPPGGAHDSGPVGENQGWVGS